MSSELISFAKMNGCGNQITVLDLREQSLTLTPQIVRAIAGHKPAAFDQLMVLYSQGVEDISAFVEIWNNDGSPAGACGNGMRCVAGLELEKIGETSTLFATGAGKLRVELEADGQISVDMGVPKFGWADIPLMEEVEDVDDVHLELDLDGAEYFKSGSVLNVGNPHIVYFVDDLDKFQLSEIGPVIENNKLFADKANVTLAQVIDPTTIQIKVWERGAGITQACGSAACAALVCAAKSARTKRDATVKLPGGDLQISWQENNHIRMTGPWELEYMDFLPAELFHAISAG